MGLPCKGKARGRFCRCGQDVNEMPVDEIGEKNAIEGHENESVLASVARQARLPGAFRVDNHQRTHHIAQFGLHHRRRLGRTSRPLLTFNHLLAPDRPPDLVQLRLLLRTARRQRRGRRRQGATTTTTSNSIALLKNYCI